MFGIFRSQCHFEPSDIARLEKYFNVTSNQHSTEKSFCPKVLSGEYYLDYFLLGERIMSENVKRNFVFFLNKVLHVNLYIYIFIELLGLQILTNGFYLQLQKDIADFCFTISNRSCSKSSCQIH